MSPSAVDVLVHVRTTRFDRPLSYLVPVGASVRIGDVVRVPLGPREVYGYALTAPAQAPTDRTLRELKVAAKAPRAFDETGLALAQFIAHTYVCTLGEALGAVVLAGAIPRFEERFSVRSTRPEAKERSGVPPRLIALIWNDLRDGFSLESLLRHPEARRAGDRAVLLAALATLARSGDLVRTRSATGPRIEERTASFLTRGTADVRGPRALALIASVEAAGTLPRAEAFLAGFSSALIARAVTAGALLENRRAIGTARESSGIHRQAFEATGEQRVAIERITELFDEDRFAETLLYGITGSGKTFVYLETIAHVVERGGRAIVLVPEISLTPQTARRFEGVFGDRVAVLHSALSQRERYEAWQAAARGDVDVVVGARSAVFAPLPDVRLIVVDEAHEPSYKQETSPRYDALAVARERMRLAGGVLVIGSATPPLPIYARALRREIPMLEMRKRATRAPLPSVHIVDMTREFAQGNRRAFSSLLVEGIGRRIAAHEKTILFVNRRGSAGFVLCRACGFVVECSRCTASLAVHRAEGLVRCHYCDLQKPIPQSCPSCGSEAIKEFGIGTERVCEEVARLWPEARIVRMDSDTTTRIGDHARILAEFEEAGDVLVGTQMVAKGLDFPGVTLVGVVAADIGLHIADYRASERTFDIVTQVCGRSGRASGGEAIVQTYSPEHPAIAHAAAHDYDGFARGELLERSTLGYPPFAEFAYVGVAGRNKTAVAAAAARYAEILHASVVGEVIGPAPHPIEKLALEWRRRIAIKAPSLDPLRAVIRESIAPLARADRVTRLVVMIDP